MVQQKYALIFSQVEMYIDENNLKVKRISHAMKVFDFYNRVSN